MPLVRLSDIKHLLQPNVLIVLQREGVFDTLEDQAARHVQDLTGIEIPAEVTAPPSWAIAPMAWFITKYAASQMAGASDGWYQRIDADYARGERELANHRTAPGTKPNSIAGLYPVQGGLEW